VDWIDLSRDKDKGWTLVNVAMNFQDYIKCGEFLD
jgi:hypothetical protein